MYALSVAHDRSAETAARWLREGEKRPEPQQFYLAVGRHQERGRAELVGEILGRHQRLQPNGAFAHLTLRVAEHEHALAAVSPAAAELRIGLAARRLIQTQLPRMQGFAVVRMGGTDEVRAHVVLSPVLRDGGAAPLLTRADVTRLDRAWDEEMIRAFRPEREGCEAMLEHLWTEASPRSEVRQLLAQYQEAQTDARAALAARMRGDIPQEALRAAGERVEAARTAWVDASDAVAKKLDGPLPIAAVTVRVPDGAAYLSRLSEEDRRDCIRSAVLETLDRRVQHAPIAVVHWQEGQDLHVRIIYQKECLERVPANRALEQRLVPELRDAVTRYDSAGRGVVGAIERAEIMLPPGHQPKVEEHAGAAEIGREVGSGVPATGLAAPRLPAQELGARTLQPDLAGERLVTARMPLSPALHELLMEQPGEARQALIQDAVHVAYPALARAGVRNNFLHQPPGSDPAAVIIYVPDRVLTDAASLGRTAEARFTHHLTMAATSTRYGGAARMASRATSVSRPDGIARDVLVGSALERAAPALARTALGRAVPVALAVSRALGRLLPGREE